MRDHLFDPDSTQPTQPDRGGGLCEKRLISGLDRRQWQLTFIIHESFKKSPP